MAQIPKTNKQKIYTQTDKIFKFTIHTVKTFSYW